jgi:hypothetical protein
MRTYLALNLKRKKFYVGSTVGFENRQKQHFDDKSTDFFHNDLRREPEAFYWFVSEDDGLDTRDEEQHYLDFYHGTMWCYNHSENASAPPPHRGTLWYTNGNEEKRVYPFEEPPKGWVEGRKDDTKLAQSLAKVGKPWSEKRRAATEAYTQSDEYRTAASRGGRAKRRLRWTNGVDEILAFECPGEEWVRKPRG